MPVSKRAVWLTAMLAFAGTAACSQTDSSPAVGQEAAPTPNSSAISTDTSSPFIATEPTLTGPVTTSAVIASTPPDIDPISTTPATLPELSEPEPEPEPTSTAAAPACLDQLSTEKKAALLVWPSVYADDWNTARSVVRDLGVGGVLVMRPRLTEAELTARLSELDDLSALGVLFATDEEGGDVQRLRDIELFPSQFDISTSFTPDEARQQVENHAQLVERVGVDFVFGPVVDVLPERGDPPLTQSRFFNGGPDVVASYGGAYVDGWASAGVTAVVKHFPGHGSASGDTHLESGVTPDLTTLESRDLLPYQELAGRAASVMVGHLTVPGLTAGRPASTSPEAIAYLRTTMGYGGALLVSDSLDMAAAGGSVPTAAVASIAAGVDVVLFTAPSQAGIVIDAIVVAVDQGDVLPSRLDEAAGRVLQHLETRGGGCR